MNEIFFSILQYRVYGTPVMILDLVCWLTKWRQPDWLQDSLVEPASCNGKKETNAIEGLPTKQ